MSHTNTSANQWPPARVLVFLVSIVAVVLGGSLILYALTPVEGRVAELTALRNAWPGVVTAVLAGLAWLKGREAAQTSADNGAQLNGQLDERIRAAVASQLIAHGLPVARRADDPTAVVPVTPPPAVEVAP